MFEAIFTLVGAALAVLAVLFLIGGLCTFFYLGYKQLFGDDNEK